MFRAARLPSPSCTAASAAACDAQRRNRWPALRDSRRTACPFWARHFHVQRVASSGCAHAAKPQAVCWPVAQVRHDGCMLHAACCPCLVHLPAAVHVHRACCIPHALFCAQPLNSAPHHLPAHSLAGQYVMPGLWGSEGFDSRRLPAAPGDVTISKLLCNMSCSYCIHCRGEASTCCIAPAMRSAPMRSFRPCSLLKLNLLTPRRRQSRDAAARLAPQQPSTAG